MDVGYFDYENQELILKNAYLETVLQELDYQDLNGADAVCSMSGEYTTDTFKDKEIKIYMFGNLDSMRIFYMEGENLYSLYDWGGFYYICTEDYAKEVLQTAILKTKNICRIYEKDGKYNMIINPSSPSYTGTVDTQGEWLSIQTATGFTFLEGKTYNIQVQNSAYLRIGKAVFYFGNEKFDYKANGSNLYIKTNYNPCVLSILEVGTVVEDDVQKGSFDKATQTLTLNNAYVVDLINRMPDTYQEQKQEFLSAIGNKDVIFDLANPVEQSGVSVFQANNITTQYGPIGMLATSSGGTYAITGSPVGVSGINEEFLSLQQMTLEDYIEQMEQQGLPYDLNVFIITGTQGNYDVTFD